MMGRLGGRRRKRNRRADFYRTEGRCLTAVILAATLPAGPSIMIAMLQEFPATGGARTIEEILAIVAIGLAILHSIGLRRQLATVKDLATKLASVEQQLTEQIGNSVREMGRSVTEIREALPTKRLGKFPAFLPHIVKLLKSANSSVVIFCDFPAYGSFSDPDTFRVYRRAIEDNIVERKQVTIACLGTNARADETHRQEVKDTEDWSAYKRTRLETFRRYIEIHSHHMKAQDLTNDEFRKFVIDEDNHTLDHSFRGAATLDVYTRPTVYFWLIDDDSMIFVIQSASRLDEYGFYTQDSHLIASLKEVARACSPLFGGPVASSVGAAG